MGVHADPVNPSSVTRTGSDAKLRLFFAHRPTAVTTSGFLIPVNSLSYNVISTS